MAQADFKYHFEKLEIWELSRQLVVRVYSLTQGFPKHEKFALCCQIQRAVVSVASNIAEGVSRQSLKERLRFLEIAHGSLMEVYCQLILSHDLAYLSAEELESVRQEIDFLAIKMSGYRKFCLQKM